jgi:hypothetical protein
MDFQDPSIYLTFAKAQKSIINNAESFE